MAGQFGGKTETTHDLPVVPDIFRPVLSVVPSGDNGLIRSEAIRAGRRTRDAGRLGGQTNSLVVGGELPNLGGAAWEWNHRMGSVVTTALGGGRFSHVFTPGAQVGKSATIQYVSDDSTSVGRAFTHSGAKIDQFAVSCGVGQLAKSSDTWVARRSFGYRTVADGVTTSGSAAITSATAAFTAGDVGKPIAGTGIPAAATILSVQSPTAATLSANATATGAAVTFTFGLAAATASYSAGLLPFSFIECSVGLNGVTVASATDYTLAGNKGLTKNFVLGSRFIREQRELEVFSYESDIKCDFDSYSLYLLQEAATVISSSTVFSNGTDSVTIAATGQLTSAVPGLTTRGQEMMDVKVDHSGTTDASTLTVTVNNSEASAV